MKTNVNKTEEQWKSIEGFESYQVSNFGNVKGKRGNLLSPGSNGRGYKQVLLLKDGQRYKRTVHSLVLNAFVPKKNETYQCNHIDGDKQNNNVKNLEWVSSKRNHEHAFELGLRKKGAGDKRSKKVIYMDLKTKTKMVFDCINDAGRFTGIKSVKISNYLNGKSVQTGTKLFLFA